MKNSNDETFNATIGNTMLYAGILDIMKENWTCNTGSFDSFWYGYDALKDCLHDKGIDTTVTALKSAMKELSKQGKVELKPSYDYDFKLCGRGWFACV